MRLDELADEYRLNVALPEIGERVREVSGKEIDFQPTDKLEVRARTKMARQEMASHVIFFNPKETPHLSHVLAHECVRILRMFKIPPEDREVPASTSETLRAARDELRAKAGFVPRHLRDKMVDMWIHGLITQVTSQPVDVRIEGWIKDNYRSLQREQRRSLRTEVRTITAGLSPEVKRMTPNAVFRRSYALNYAYLDHIGEILKRTFESKFRGNPEIVASGETLSGILEDDEISDQELINRVAEAVQVRDWFIWVDFEDMPKSYYAS